MKPRPDLLTKDAPTNAEVFQLTDEAIPSCHVYMEAQIFTPDSKRFVLHRSAHPHGSNKSDPEHRYLLCDLENGGELSPLTDELGVTAPSVSPDGTYMYYFINETSLNAGQLTLKRVRLDGSDRETLMVLDAPPPGAACIPSHIYPLSTISSDGKRLALSAFFGDGDTEDAPFGLMVFDLEKGAVRVVLAGATWLNMHPQYCRSTAPEAAHDILIQENHGSEYTKDGNCTRLVGGDGADIHLIRDDGSDFRSLPWGRDGNEFCQGHQCWLGDSTLAITSTSVRDSRHCELILSPPASFAGHIGISTPGGQRNNLSRVFPKPAFYHFATDLAGKRLITDARIGNTWLLFTAEFGPAPDDPLTNWQFVLDSQTDAIKKTAHIHPFLSRDGTTGFFNSEESGVLQAYMVTGLFPT
ncbi:MAG TPA: hypothetical protein PLD73_06115 [Candidatus Hydrogenedentes bacterium]|jgi:hypothetical protein|nr:hypothetical protein [Candidatus Hydrogenedentota bacterium]HPJ98097.1 hypothetical protein [Candidatus Hydrogenedentota bacterium]